MTPEVVAARASKRMDRDLSAWLLGGPGELGIPLHPPTGRQAAAHIDAARRFIGAWQRHPARDGVQVTWEDRSWHAASLGVQRVPVRFTATGPEAVAETAERLTEWREVQRRFRLLVDGRSPAVRETAARRLKAWGKLDDTELVRIHSLSEWFVDHPDSGLLPRAVAVEGVHGKWLEQHRGLVESLVSAARGFPDGSRGDLGLGVIEPVIRVRRLDPGLRGSEGIEDISVPVSAAARLFSEGSRPRTVLMVENLATFLSLPATVTGTGAVVIWTKGYAVDLVADLPWLTGARLFYWGDLDADGFAILNRLRAALPADGEVDSVLMDPVTVNRFAALGVGDPGDTGRVLPRLTAGEQQSRDLLVMKGPLRIEQERVAWGYALERLAAAGFPVGRVNSRHSAGPVPRI